MCLKIVQKMQKKWPNDCSNCRYAMKKSTKKGMKQRSTKTIDGL